MSDLDGANSRSEVALQDGVPGVDGITIERFIVGAISAVSSKKLRTNSGFKFFRALENAYLLTEGIP